MSFDYPEFYDTNDQFKLIKEMQGTNFKDHASGGSIRRQIVNPDLAEEKKKCNFD